MTDRKFKKKLKKIQKKGEQQRKISILENAYAQYYPDKKKKKVSNIMLVITVIAIVGYVIADFVLQYKVGVEVSPTITTCWFAFWSAEIFTLAGIKISKVKNNYDGISYFSGGSMAESDMGSDDGACG